MFFELILVLKSRKVINVNNPFFVLRKNGDEFSKSQCREHLTEGTTQMFVTDTF